MKERNEKFKSCSISKLFVSNLENDLLLLELFIIIRFYVVVNLVIISPCESSCINMQKGRQIRRHKSDSDDDSDDANKDVKTIPSIAPPALKRPAKTVALSFDADEDNDDSDIKIKK